MMVADDRRDAVSPRVTAPPDGALADALVGGLLVLDTEGIVRAANVSAQRLLAQPEDALVGRPIVAALPVTTRRGDRPLAAEKHPAMVALRSGEAQQRAALRVNRPDGASRWFAVDAVPIRDAGRVAHVVVTFNDVTVRREGDERLRLLESVVVTANDAVLITEAEPIDLPGPRIIYVNDAFTRMTGYSAEEVLGRTPRLLQGPLSSRVTLDRLRAALARWESITVEMCNYRKDGTEFWVEFSIVPVTNAHGWYTHWVSVQRDITARKQIDSLRHQATHDALTELPNRVLLQDRLTQALADAARDATPIALLLLDLDRFKEINDTLGHHVGDQLLQWIGPRVLELLRGADTMARLGGDEFAVLLPGAEEAAATALATEILAALAVPFMLEGQSLDVGASIGIALAPAHGDDAATLLRHADVAMYVAKRGHQGHAVYDPAQDGNNPLRLGLMGELRAAIAQGELLLYYQPKLDHTSGRVSGVEALLRWPHPVHGLIAPDQFIPLAEQTGLIAPLTWWVLETALAQCQTWARAGLLLGVAVNLSARTLHDLALPARITALLATYGVPAGLLTLEVTESALMADPTRALNVLTQLAEQGVCLAIDDFGTGYSSLAYLKRLPVHQLKIDRSFIQHLVEGGADAAIVVSTIGLGHHLGLRVVAEGVETAEAWQLLAASGCDVSQGYHLSRPVTATELERWLRAGGNDLAALGEQIAEAVD